MYCCCRVDKNCLRVGVAQNTKRMKKAERFATVDFQAPKTSTRSVHPTTSANGPIGITHQGSSLPYNFPVRSIGRERWESVKESNCCLLLALLPTCGHFCRLRAKTVRERNGPLPVLVAGKARSCLPLLGCRRVSRFGRHIFFFVHSQREELRMGPAIGRRRKEGASKQKTEHAHALTRATTKHPCARYVTSAKNNRCMIPCYDGMVRGPHQNLRVLLPFPSRVTSRRFFLSCRSAYS